MNELLRLLPERQRAIALACVAWFLITQVIVSVLVQALPARAMQHPRWGGIVRAMHTFGHMRFYDELGTLKLPGSDVMPDPRSAAIEDQALTIQQLRQQIADTERSLSMVQQQALTTQPAAPKPHESD